MISIYHQHAKEERIVVMMGARISSRTLLYVVRFLFFFFFDVCVCVFV